MLEDLPTSACSSCSGLSCGGQVMNLDNLGLIMNCSGSFMVAISKFHLNVSSKPTNSKCLTLRLDWYGEVLYFICACHRPNFDWTRRPRLFYIRPELQEFFLRCRQVDEALLKPVMEIFEEPR